MRRADLAVAVQAQDEHGRGAWVEHDVLEQQQRGRVGPLQVVEHEQHRRADRDGRQQCSHRLEEPVALALLLCLVRKRRETGSELGHERDQRCRINAQLCFQVDGIAVGHVLSQSLHERLVGDDRLLERAAGEDHRVVGIRLSGTLSSEATLADAGLAQDEGQAALSAGGGRPRCPEPIALGSTANEGAAAAGPRGQPGWKWRALTGRRGMGDLEGGHRMGHADEVEESGPLEGAGGFRPGQRRDEVGHEDLPARRSLAQLTGLDRRAGDVVTALRDHGRLGSLAQLDADANVEPFGPSAVVPLRGSLHGHGTSHGVGGDIEDHEHSVTVAMELASMMRSNSVAQQRQICRTRNLDTAFAKSFKDRARLHQIGLEERDQLRCGPAIASGPAIGRPRPSLPRARRGSSLRHPRPSTARPPWRWDSVAPAAASLKAHPPSAKLSERTVSHLPFNGPVRRRSPAATRPLGVLPRQVVDPG